MNALPLGQAVNCRCLLPQLNADPGVGNPWSENRVTSCLVCGKVECYRPTGDEPRSAGPVGGCNFLIALPDAMYHWLAQWPKKLTIGFERPYFAAPSFRLTTIAELHSARQAAAVAQAGLTPAQRLLQFPIPAAAPPALPATLCHELRYYPLLWEHARNGETSLNTFLKASIYCK